MKTINLIGPGRVGETLLRCVKRADLYVVQDVCGRRFERLERLVQKLGTGRATSLSNARAADVWLIAVPDGAIKDVAADLAKRDILPATAVHFSGFHSAEVLAPLAQNGWQTASAHPNLSFADPVSAAESFAGTLVGVEGASDALQQLFVSLGARTFPLNAENKALYHAAAVFSNNFTTVMQAIAHQTWAKAGLSDEIGRELSADLLRAATENVISMGPAAALTGPAARGDADVVRVETDALSAWEPRAGKLYAELSRCAARLKTTGNPF